ncbi:MAG: acyl-CoA thioesterase [Fusobacteriaceae bacterium]
MSIFKTDYKVGIGDINYGGHMGNEVSLRLFQQVRVEFLNSLGLSELNIGQALGVIQVESYVKYKKEVYFGNLLLLEIKKINFGKSSIEFVYNIMNENKEVALEGTTTLLAFNYENKKVARVPKSFIELIESKQNI